MHNITAPGSKVLYNEGSPSVLVITGGEVGASSNLSPAELKNGDGKTASIQPDKSTDDPVTVDWVPWGDNDRFPQELHSKYLDKLGVIQMGISVNADMHFGNGPMWFTDEYTEAGKVVKKPIKIAGWREFVRNSAFLISLSEIVESLETYYIAFPEILLDKTGKVVSVKCLDTPLCRFGKKNKAGRVEYLYYGVDDDITEKEVKRIPIYDPSNPTKHKKFIFPLQYRCFNRFYYPEPCYFATMKAGWADIAIEVPKLIKAIYLNSTTLKFIVKVPIEVFKNKFKDWDTKTEEEQLAIQETFKTEVDERLAGADNAGKSIFSIYNNPTEVIEIVPIKQYIDNSSEVINNVAANSEMLFALGLDTALVGINNPGGKDLNGSGGSDKRESRKNKQANSKRERLVSLQLLEFIAFTWNIDPEIYPSYVDSDTSQTLDENPTGKQTITQ